MSRRTIVRVSVLSFGLAVITALLVVRSLVYIPVLSDDKAVAYDAASLPDSLRVCGRMWRREELVRTRSAEELTARFGVVPSLVTPRQFAACPRGACSAMPARSCSTVIVARVGEDAYTAYGLADGP